MKSYLAELVEIRGLIRDASFEAERIDCEAGLDALKVEDLSEVRYELGAIQEQKDAVLKALEKAAKYALELKDGSEASGEAVILDNVDDLLEIKASSDLALIDLKRFNHEAVISSPFVDAVTIDRKTFGEIVAVLESIKKLM